MRALCAPALLAVALLAVALLAAPPAAAAHGFDVSGDYLTAGVDLGLTLDDDFGALAGFEISFTEVTSRGPWGGVVLAATWLSGSDLGRYTIGAEAGYGFAGLEAGVNVDTDAVIGGRLRALGTLGVISAYLGLAFGPETRGELGVILKVPIPL